MSQEQTETVQDDDTKMDVDLTSSSRSKLACAKYGLPKGKTLLNLPMELQEMVLMQAISSEVRKAHRPSWNKVADRVAERLGDVCPEWKRALNTDGFRKSLHELIDSYPQVTISLNVLGNYRFTNCVAAASLDDQVFLLRQEALQTVSIAVYDRSDLSTAKKIIPLPGVTIAWGLVALSQTQCLYVLHQTTSGIEVWRVPLVTDEDQGSSQISPWIACSDQLLTRMSASTDGRLVIFQGPLPSTIRVYGSDGVLQREVKLAQRVTYLHDILPKLNGNFVLVKKNVVVEVDGDGETVNEYTGESRTSLVYCAIDRYDRIAVFEDSSSEARLLDSEFCSDANRISVPMCHNNANFYWLHYNPTRDEFLAFESAAFCDRPTRGSQCLTIFNFTEESGGADGAVDSEAEELERRAFEIEAFEALVREANIDSDESEAEEIGGESD